MVSGSSTLTAAAAVPLLYSATLAEAAHFAGATGAFTSDLYSTGYTSLAAVSYAASVANGAPVV